MTLWERAAGPGRRVLFGSESDARLPAVDERRIGLSFFLAAVLVYVPGIWWGLPGGSSADLVLAWGSDELAPLGPLAQVGAVLVGREGATFSPQYPLLHYVVEALFQAPYLAWLYLTGGLTDPGTAFPYGLADPRSSLSVLTLLGRLPSLLMAAGTVTLAWKTAREWWDRPTGLLAGLVVLLMYPMFYYARTSNVDMAGLFWSAAGLFVFQRCLRDGLTFTRAVTLGLLAAAATATKDAFYAFFAILAVVLSIHHLRSVGEGQGDPPGARIRPLLVGVATFGAAYSLASGLVFSPEYFLTHVDFILHGSQLRPPEIDSSYGARPLSVGSMLVVTGETGQAVAQALGLPLLVLAAVGTVTALVRERYRLLLLLPPLGVFVGVVLPVRFVRLRFVVPIAFGLAFFAARGIVVLWRGAGGRYRWLVGPVVALSILWSGLRGTDLTQQMIRDARYEVASWLRQHAVAGDRVGFYGSPRKLPNLEQDVEAVTMPGQRSYGGDPPPEPVTPEFVLVIPQQKFERSHEWTLPDSTFRSLMDGSLGYRQMLAVRGPVLLEAGVISFVNPPCRVFVRDDIVARIPAEQRRVALPPPATSAVRSAP